MVSTPLNIDLTRRPPSMARGPTSLSRQVVVATHVESRRNQRHPISRWYIIPLANGIAKRLVSTSVRPWHVTVAGLVASLAASALLVTGTVPAPFVAGVVMCAWLLDRVDGLLARRQGTVSRWGAWLDQNIDELGDVALHVGVAAAAAAASGTSLPWLLCLALVGGKYLFHYGLHAEAEGAPPTNPANAANPADSANHTSATTMANPKFNHSFWRRLYHLPGDADVRVHLLVVALLSGYLTCELALVAAYYNLRWIVRYGLVARRLREVVR